MTDLTPPQFDMPPKPCCEDCRNGYFDSDGMEYSEPFLRCRDHRMENLKGFPFYTRPRCFAQRETTSD